MSKEELKFNVHRFSANTFSSVHKCPFSVSDYSKFKYGSKNISRKFGIDLATKFLSSSIFIRLNSLLKDRELVVSSAPWKNIPVASTILKDYFISKFNAVWTVDNNTVEDLKIYRSHSYNDNYGDKSEEERHRLISSDSFHIDKDFIKGKVLLAIDDVRITGSHERRMIELLKSVDFDGDVIFLYFANYSGDRPEIEDEINFYSIKSLLDIDSIIKNDEFIFNTRVTKYILSSSTEEFKGFINYQSSQFRHNLMRCLTSNNYHKIPEFKSNYEILKQMNKLN